MRLWPFGRKREEESFFGASRGATVAPSAPPGVKQAESAPEQDVFKSLAAAGINIPAGANVQVSTHTTELKGEQAAQFLSQIGSLLSAAGATGSVQVHPSIQIVSEGRMLESSDKLRSAGVDAQATVKDLEEKPVSIGDTHIVKLRLEVTKPGAEPYEVTTAALVPTKVTEEFAEGKTFRAKVDPEDPQQVLVIWD